MARHNDISLYCVAVSKPVIKDMGEKQRATLSVKIVKGARDSYDGEVHLKVTYPVVATSNKRIIEVLEKVNENDILLIKGNVITTQTTKKPKCEHCGFENRFDGILTYINPINVLIISTNNTKESALENIVKNREFSNEVCIIGHLCSTPERIPVVKDIIETQYKIGIPRKFHIREEVEDVKSDFPYIKSYGKNAEDDMKYAKVGTTVLIDGYLQSRRFPRTCTCEQCGQDFVWHDSVLEIVPYQSEYLKNLRIEEEED